MNSVEWGPVARLWYLYSAGEIVLTSMGICNWKNHQRRKMHISPHWNSIRARFYLKNLNENLFVHNGNVIKTKSKKHVSNREQNRSDGNRENHGKCTTLIDVVEIVWMAKENNWIEFNKIDSLQWNRYFLFLLRSFHFGSFFVANCDSAYSHIFHLCLLPVRSLRSLLLIDINNRGTFATKSLNYTLLSMPLVGSTLSLAFSLFASCMIGTFVFIHWLTLCTLLLAYDVNMGKMARPLKPF